MGGAAPSSLLRTRGEIEEGYSHDRPRLCKNICAPDRCLRDWHWSSVEPGRQTWTGPTCSLQLKKIKESWEELCYCRERMPSHCRRHQALWSLSNRWAFHSGDRSRMLEVPLQHEGLWGTTHALGIEAAAVWLQSHSQAREGQWECRWVVLTGLGAR